MGFSTGTAIILQSVFDILPLIVLILLNPRFSLHNNSSLLKQFGFWLLLGLFFFLTIITTLIHKGSITSSFVHCGILFRYIPLAFIISTFQPEVLMDKIQKHIYISFSIVLCIAFLQILFGMPMMTFFQPLTSNTSLVLRVYAAGDIMGPFKNSIGLAYFLLITFVLILFDKRIEFAKLMLLLPFVIIALIYAGSIAVLLAFFFVIAIKYTYKKHILKVFLSIILSILFCLILIIYRTEISVFVSQTFYSRLGILFFTLPEFIKDFSFDTLFGIGTDLSVVFKKLMELPRTPLIFKWDGNAVSLADVYWVALLIYHGIIGLFLLFMSFFLLFKYSMKVKYINRNFTNYDYPLMLQSIFLVILLLGLFNQILVVREFALIFWIIIGIISSEIVYSSAHNLLKK